MSGMTERPTKPGTEQLRHAIVALPIGLICLALGALVGGEGAADGISTALLLLGALATLFGVLRLAQGLYQRVA